MNNKPTLLILAAGLASRYGSLKQIDKIGPSGERIIDYSVYDAIRAGFGKIVYVIRKSFEDEFKSEILNVLPDSIETDYVFQELDSFNKNINYNPERVKPWGTGHALLTSESVIKNPFVIINADDFYGFESYKIAYNFLITKPNEANTFALIGFELSKTLSEYGSVSRGICATDENDYLKSVVERTEIKKENEKIFFKDEYENWQHLFGNEICSMNMFAFKPSIYTEAKPIFFDFLKKNKENLKSEFYLPALVDQLIKLNKAKVKVLKTDDQWFGLTYKEDKEIVRSKILKLTKDGKYPDNLWKSF